LKLQILHCRSLFDDLFNRVYFVVDFTAFHPIFAF